MGIFSWLSKPHIGAALSGNMGHCHRISSVKTDKRVVALLFENGPCFAPCEPAREHDMSVFDSILSTLDKFGAKGTFAYVGSTADNYPDNIGEDSEGEKYSHLPLYECDEQGGIFYHTKPIASLVSRGHEIVNHSCAHMPIGRGNLPRGRACHGNMADVLEDYGTFNSFVKNTFAQKVKFAVLPRGINQIDGRFSAYDAMTLLRMHLLGWSIDCGGKMPSDDGYAAEVKAISDAVCRPLRDRGDDALCGKIIRLHDGFNREGRSPVCDALPKILDALHHYGYEVVTASELVKISPFADLSPENSAYEDVMYLISKGRAVVYEDGSIRLDKPITRGEAAAMIAPMSAFLERIRDLAENPDAASPFTDLPLSHPYQSAARWAQANTGLQMHSGKFNPDRLLSRVEFDSLIAAVGGKTSPLDADRITRAEFIKYLVKAMKKASE